MKSLDAWDSGIQVRNPGASPTRVSVRFYSEVGVVVHQLDDVILAASAKTYYPPSMPQLPAGFRGSAIVQSLTGQALTAIVNQVGTGEAVGGK